MQQSALGEGLAQHVAICNLDADSPSVQVLSNVLLCRLLPLTAKELLKDTLEILYRNFWPLILIFALTDAAMFALHRLGHRITNEGEACVGDMHPM